MPDTTVRAAQGEVPLGRPVPVNEMPLGPDARAGAGSLVRDPVSIDHPGDPYRWPVMSEDQVRRVLDQDMRRCAGVPTSWWGEDQEVVVATGDPSIAARAADELARRDLGVGYLTAVQTGAVVVGPVEAVLVGWADSDHIDWVAAPADADYALQLCLVRPAYPVTAGVRPRAAVVDLAAAAVARLRAVAGGDPR